MQPIVTPEEMAAIDAAAPDPLDALVERAGAAVARSAIDLLGGTYGRRVVVVAGKGNNGADGRAAARRLEARGVRCRVIDAAGAPPILPPCDLVIDAAYGTGFRGTYEAPRPTDPDTLVLAVDIVSGISGLTGEAAGSVLPADRTVTFAALKPGLILAAGAEASGAIEVADIGLDVSGVRAHRLEAGDVRDWMPIPERNTHKWRSAVWLIGGSPGMTGAIRLAAGGAQRCGAGYVRVSVPGAGHEVDAPVEAVVVPLGAGGWVDQVLADADRFGALAIGPGLGRDERTAEAVRDLVERSPIATIVDGDGLRALGLISGGAGGVATGGGSLTLTPHDGEFEALVGRSPDADRFAAVRDLAADAGATVLLKGSTTLVSSPGGRVLAVTAGDARLATAGSGDVLTGMIAGLTALGLAGPEAAASAALLHGTAGDLAWRRGLVAGDLVDHLPAALTEVVGG